MSNVITKVVAIDEVRPHPNADRLDIAVIGGWQCVVPRGQYSAGDKIVYFTPNDTLLPRQWTDTFGVTKYCQGKEGDMFRIRQTKLRGEYSFGLVVRPADPSWEIGRDVGEFYGVKKYIPPVLLTSDEDEVECERLLKYTDIENLRNFPHVLQPGEEVVATEKLHGCNVRSAMIEGVRMAGSHTRRKRLPKDEAGIATSLYWLPFTIPGVAGLLESLAKDHAQVILFGETIGKQSLRYGLNGSIRYAAFDLMLDGRYADYDRFVALCDEFAIPRVPEVYRGPFPQTIRAMKDYADGNTLMGRRLVGSDLEQEREGIVIKPVIERYDPAVGRVILKYLSDAYLGKHADDDTTDA